MEGEEIYQILERMRHLAGQLNGASTEFGDRNISEYNSLVRQMQIVSLNELIDYHNFVRGKMLEYLEKLGESRKELRDCNKGEGGLALDLKCCEEELELEKNKKDKLIGRLNEIGTPESREIIYGIIDEVYG